MKPIEFTKLMKMLAISYSKEFDEEMVEIWYMQFKNVTKDIFQKAINEIVRRNRFMPSIAELLEECEKQKENNQFEILEYMKKRGYFKTPYEYDKASKFFEEKNIPKWLLEDAKKYYKEMSSNKLEHNETLMIGG